VQSSRRSYLHPTNAYEDNAYRFQAEFLKLTEREKKGIIFLNAYPNISLAFLYNSEAADTL